MFSLRQQEAILDEYLEANLRVVLENLTVALCRDRPKDKDLKQFCLRWLQQWQLEKNPDIESMMLRAQRDALFQRREELKEELGPSTVTESSSEVTESEEEPLSPLSPTSPKSAVSPAASKPQTPEDKRALGAEKAKEKADGRKSVLQNLQRAASTQSRLGALMDSGGKSAADKGYFTDFAEVDYEKKPEEEAKPEGEAKPEEESMMPEEISPKESKKTLARRASMAAQKEHKEHKEHKGSKETNHKEGSKERTPEEEAAHQERKLQKRMSRSVGDLSALEKGSKERAKGSKERTPEEEKEHQERKLQKRMSKSAGSLSADDLKKLQRQSSKLASADTGAQEGEQKQEATDTALAPSGETGEKVETVKAKVAFAEEVEVENIAVDTGGDEGGDEDQDKDDDED